MKEQTRNTKVQINEEEIGKLPEKEFRIMIVKMVKNLENKMDFCVSPLFLHLCSILLLFIIIFNYCV